MKKSLYFLPVVLLVGFFIRLLFLLSFAGNTGIYLALLGVIALFLASGILMATGRWYGCLPEVLLGVWIIYLSAGNPTPVLDEAAIGIVLAIYYLICGFLSFRTAK